MSGKEEEPSVATRLWDNARVRYPRAKALCYPLLYKAKAKLKKSQVTARPRGLNKGELAQKRMVAMDNQARLRAILEELPLAELRLVLRFAEWLKERQDSGVAD